MVDQVGYEDHTEPEAALRKVQTALQEAAEDGKWMAAVWSVGADGMLRLLTRTTWNFPVGDVTESLAQMRRTFDDQLPTPQTLRVRPMEPLPMAKAFASTSGGVRRPADHDDDE